MSHGYVPEAAIPVPSVPDVVEEGPPSPEALKHTGLSEEFVTDLILKLLYTQGARSGAAIAESVRLPFPLIDDLLLTLQQRRMVEVLRTQGPTRPGYVFDLAGEGRTRGRDALEASQYVGPAPVPLQQYRQWVEAFSIQRARVDKSELRRGFNWLVLDEHTLDQIGPAINSAKSLFLYGHPGNGKTASAETIARLLGGDIYVPYAIEVDGQVIVVYDPIYHELVPDDRPGPGEDVIATQPPHDMRFAHVLRPVVLTGGELTLDLLDLRYDPFAKMYQAPFQVKANGGVLIVDDFGRQRVPARDLLNRWIVPLEKRIDFLSLHTGGKFPVPFDCLLILATNLRPEDLVDEAFMRRIHYKIHVHSPTRAQFEEIFMRATEERGLKYERRAVEQLFTEYYETGLAAPRGCHPRDILDHVFDFARYLGKPPALSSELLSLAARSYFIDSTAEGGQ